MPIVHELPYNTYDTPGNIRQVKQGSTVTGTYTYGNSDWRDLLTAYNNQPIAYEGQTFNGSTVSGTPVSGNPISYFNGTRWEFDWSEGRQLVTATAAADGTVTVQVLDFAYDNAGSPYALTYTSGTTSTTYYYITNLQGDVLRLVNTAGETVAEYDYDPWGRLLTVTDSSGTQIATVNPLRYRGYYYDSESGFYYLQSRYFDPVICRFINADGYSSTGQGFSGHNMFVYCKNCPSTD